MADDLEMEIVRCGNIHNLNIRVFNHRVPVCRLFLKAEARPGGTRASFYAVRTNDELRMKRTLGKELGNLPVGSAVHLTHPTHANHANSDDTRHFVGLLQSVPLRGSHSRKSMHTTVCESCVFSAVVGVHQRSSLRRIRESHSAVSSFITDSKTSAAAPARSSFDVQCH